MVFLQLGSLHKYKNSVVTVLTATVSCAEDAPDSAASSESEGGQLLQVGPSNGRPRGASGRRSPELWEPTADMLADWAAHQAGLAEISKPLKAGLDSACSRFTCRKLLCIEHDHAKFIKKLPMPSGSANPMKMAMSLCRHA